MLTKDPFDLPVELRFGFGTLVRGSRLPLYTHLDEQRADEP